MTSCGALEDFLRFKKNTTRKLRVSFSSDRSNEEMESILQLLHNILPNVSLILLSLLSKIIMKLLGLFGGVSWV